MAEKGYKKLRVYQEAHKLVKDIYLVTEKFPKSEIFGLVSQMRRAAVSVPANIIEGQARRTKREFTQFISIANGSLVELEYYLELVLELGYLYRATYDRIKAQRLLVGSLLGGLARYLKNKLDT